MEALATTYFKHIRNLGKRAKIGFEAKINSTEPMHVEIRMIIFRKKQDRTEKAYELGSLKQYLCDC